MAELYRPPLPNGNSNVPFSDSKPQPVVKQDGSKPGMFMRALDYLSRGNYASANAAMALVKGNFKDIGPAAVRGLKGIDKTTYSKVLEQAGVPEGNRVPTLPFHARTIVGTGLDIALDPVTYASFGVMSGAGKLSKAIGLGTKVLNPEGLKLAETLVAEVGEEAAGKSLSKIIAKTGSQYLETSARQVAKARGGLSFAGKTIIGGDTMTDLIKSTKIPKALEAITKSDVGMRVQTKIGDWFIPHMKPPEVDTKDWKKIEDFKDLSQQLYRIRSLDVLDEAFRAQRQFSKQELQDIYKAIPKAKGGDLTSILSKYPRRVVDEANNWRGIADRLYLLDNNIPVERANEILSKLPENTGLTPQMVKDLQLTGDLPKKLLVQFREGYIPGIYKRNSGLVYKYSSPKIFNTPEEAAAAGYQAVDGGNVASIMGARGVSSARTASFKNLASNVANSFGQVIQEGEQSAANIMGKTQLRNPAMKQFMEAHLGGPVWFKKELAPVIDQMGAKYEDAGTKSFLNGVKAINAKFARSVTTPFPAHHITNLVGNAWNMYLAGVNPAKLPVLMEQAGEVQALRHAVAMGDTATIEKLGSKTLKGSNMTYLDVVKSSMLHGVAGQGFIGDLSRELGVVGDTVAAAQDIAIPKNLKGMKKTALSKAIHPLNTASEMGKVIEDNSRLSLFLHELSKGRGVDEASNTVKKFLFDYGDLTEFEKKGMRTLIPFYAWSRKNIPLQLEQIIKQPGKYANIKKVGRTFEDTAEPGVPDEVATPDYIRDKYYIRLRKDDKGKQRYVVPNFPFQDLARLNSVMNPGKGIENEIPSITPVVKSIFEFGFNYDSLHKRQLADSNLPDKAFTWEKAKKLLANNLRYQQVLGRLSDDQKSTLDKTLRDVFGVYVFSSDPKKAMEFWRKDQKAEKAAVKRLEKDKKEKAKAKEKKK